MTKIILKFCLVSLLVVACSPTVRYNSNPEALKSSTKKSQGITSLNQAYSNPQYVTKSDEYHIVQRGENLYQISKSCGIPVNDLKLYNNLDDDEIFIGQKIYFTPVARFYSKYITRRNIPATKYHTVANGETLADISQMYGIFVLNLVAYNELESTQVEVGQKVWLVAGKVEKKSEISKKKVTYTTPKRKSIKTLAPATTANSVRTKVTTGVGGGTIIAAKSVVPKVVPTVSRVSTKTISQAKPQHSKLSLPLEGGRVISNFGTHGVVVNKGIDIAGKDGQPVNAVLPGKVIFAGEQRGYGNVIVLEHEKFVMTVYAHNKANLVRSGDKVTAGQPIAKLGQTGRVDTPQLHFEYRVKGKAVDPRKVLVGL